MPVEEPRRKRKRGIEEPERYPEPKAGNQAANSSARRTETTQESATGKRSELDLESVNAFNCA
jgi:hypothetical protein